MALQLFAVTITVPDEEVMFGSKPAWALLRFEKLPPLKCAKSYWSQFLLIVTGVFCSSTSLAKDFPTEFCFDIILVVKPLWRQLWYYESLFVICFIVLSTFYLGDLTALDYDFDVIIGFWERSFSSILLRFYGVHSKSVKVDTTPAVPGLLLLLFLSSSLRR